MVFFGDKHSKMDIQTDSTGKVTQKFEK